MGSAGPVGWLGDGDALADPECPGEGALEPPAGPGAERSQSGNRPAAALNASAAASATATMALAVPAQDRDLCNRLPLPRRHRGRP